MISENLWIAIFISSGSLSELLKYVSKKPTPLSDIDLITDEKSTNGIFVNGDLTDESVLTSGSRIQIGKFNLIITKVDKKWI